MNFSFLQEFWDQFNFNEFKKEFEQVLIEKFVNKGFTYDMFIEHKSFIKSYMECQLLLKYDAWFKENHSELLPSINDYWHEQMKKKANENTIGQSEEC